MKKATHNLNAMQILGPGLADFISPIHGADAWSRWIGPMDQADGLGQSPGAMDDAMDRNVVSQT